MRIYRDTDPRHHLQCCGTGMMTRNPDFFPHSRSLITDPPKTTIKRRGKNLSWISDPDPDPGVKGSGMIIPDPDFF
jgi:hypothetical protein